MSATSPKAPNRFVHCAAEVPGGDVRSGIGFGCMGITAFYGAAQTDEATLSLLTGVYNQGCRHFDTAETYKTGNPLEDSTEDTYNETQLSEFLASVPRSSFTIATKFLPFKWGGACDYATVKKALEGSLSRLGLSYVDVYYCHRLPSLEGALEYAASCKRLQEEGLLRHIGLSEVCGAWLRKISEVARIACVQQEWSLMTRNLEEELLPVCKELGVTVVAYSPLARNLLCGEITTPPKDWRAGLPRYSAENLKKNLKLAGEVKALAKEKGCSAAQLSLAWLLKKASLLGVGVIAIPGTTKLSHATDNIGSAKIVLADEDLPILEALAAGVAGARNDGKLAKVNIEGQTKTKTNAASEIDAKNTTTA